MMRSNSEVTKIGNGIYPMAIADIQTLAKVNEGKVKSLAKASVEDGLAIISGILTSLECVLLAPAIDHVSLPKYIAKADTTDEDKLTTFRLVIRSRLKAPVKHKEEKVFTVGKDLIEEMGRFMLDALFTMFYQDMAYENVTALNEKLVEIAAENNIPNNLEFTITEDSALVVSITDEKLVLNASVPKALDIATLGIFQSGDSYCDLVRNEAIKKLVSELSACQTTVQLIKGNVALVKDLTGITTKKRASKLIRGSYHRKFENLDGVKAGVGYFENTVQIDGADVKVFALVEKAEDGTMSVVLHPFDVATMFNVDYDVLAK